MARAKWQPTPQELLDIEKYASEGVPREIIANILGISPNTLNKHCGELLDRFQDKVKAEFMGALYKLGVKELVPSAIFFYLKTRCGFRETGDLTGESAKPVRLVFNRGQDRPSKVITEKEKIKKAS